MESFVNFVGATWRKKKKKDEGKNVSLVLVSPPQYENDICPFGFSSLFVSREEAPLSGEASHTLAHTHAHNYKYLQRSRGGYPSVKSPNMITLQMMTLEDH